MQLPVDSQRDCVRESDAAQPISYYSTCLVRGGGDRTTTAEADSSHGK